MYKWVLLALMAAFQGNALAADEHGEGITKETLLKTETSWEGTAYQHYPAGAPQITMLKVTVEPNKVLAWHTHPCISAVYMTGGSVSLTVKATGVKKTFKQGDSFTDTVDIVHQGVSGDKGAEMLVFFACADNKSLTVKLPNSFIFCGPFGPHSGEIMVALWMVVASLFFALMGACIKLASAKVGFFDIVFYRSFINVAIVAALIKIKNIGFRTQHLGLHMKRAAIGNAAMYCGFYSLIHLPIATATTLGYTNPIFQSLIAFVTARGQLTGKLLFSVLLGFVGILILLRPDVPHGEFAATLIGLLSGLLTALAYFNVGKLVRTGEPELRVVFYFSLVGTLVGTVMTAIVGFAALDAATLLCVCAIGVFGSLGQITMTRAYGSGNAVTVGILSYTTIIFSTLLGYLVFAETLSSIAAVGMALIILSGALAVWRRAPVKTVKAASM